PRACHLTYPEYVKYLQYASVKRAASMDPTDQFARTFASFWQQPSPQRMPEILHPDIVLIQPLSAPMYGLAAAQDEFQRIFQWLPDLTATVDRWRGEGDTLFVEFRLHATLGSERIEWPVIDRFLLRDGKAVE